MRNLLIAVAVAVCVPLALAGQDNTAQVMKDYSRTMASDDLPLTLVHLNDKTVPVLFQAPTLYAMRARAKEATTIYVQAVVDNNVELDTTNFILEQDGMSSPGSPSSIHNFTKGKVKLKLGDHVDGVLSFTKLVDVSKPFAVRHGHDRADFKFTSEQAKLIMPAAPASPASSTP
jgi:hypothetical protein